MDETEALRRLAEAPVGYLVTVRSNGDPHIVPFVFVVEDRRILSMVDAKPKETTDLRRIRNIRANSSVSVLVDHYEPDWGGRAYYGGVMIYSLDNPRRASAGNTQLQVYRGVVKHELMHAIQFLLQGSDDPNLADAWLTEGIAEYVSGGTAGGSIHDLARLDSLIDKYGALNPIAMHQYHYPDVELIAYNYYYPMFELAVTYLVDPSGAGGAKSSIRDIFLDVGKGIPFPTAFEDRLGIGLAKYEDQFFDRIRAFLR